MSPEWHGDAAERAASGGDDPRVAAAVAEYQALVESGRRPRRSEFLARHPGLGPALADGLDMVDFLRSAGLGLSDGSAAPVPPAGPIPGVLGDYRVVREVGRGGMGVVYEAEQISLGRRVALKVLPFAAVMDPRHLQRFHNEARAAAALDHPHAVKVYGVGQERGVHFIALQFIDGRSLADLIRERREGPGDPAAAAGDSAPTASLVGGGATTGFPADRPGAASRTPLDPGYARRVAEWGAQAAEALEHAHALGVVHRDVKPGNLLVDGRGHLYVADFGLAKVAAADAGVTGTGDVLGTLRYMAPEQASAKHDLVDHRADVYALGATLYELLTLTPAFGGADRADLLRRVTGSEPRSVRAIDPKVPRDLETIVLKAMAKDPPERYQSARELADDLRRFLAHRPVLARRPSAVDRARKFARRNRTLVAASALAVAGILGGSAVSLWQASRAAREASLSKAEAERARAAEARAADEAALALSAVQFVDEDLLSQADVANQPGGPGGRDPDVTVGTLLDRAALTVGERFVGQPLAEAVVRLTIGRAYVALGRYADAEPHLGRAVAIRESLLGPGDLGTLAAKGAVAELYVKQERPGPAEDLLREVLEGRLARLGPDHLDTHEARNDLAVVHHSRGRYDLAEPVLREALGVHTARLGPDHRRTLAITANLASVYRAQRKDREAEALFKELLASARARHGPDHPLAAEAQVKLAAVYSTQGRLDEAERNYREAIDVLTRIRGPNHSATTAAKVGLAAAYRDRARFGEAERMLNEAIRADAAEWGEGHPYTLTVKGMLAELYRLRGQWGKAEALFREVADGLAARRGARHPSTLEARHNLAGALLQLGRLDEAEAILEAVLAASIERNGPGHYKVLQTKSHLAQLYLQRGKLERAEELSRESAEGEAARLGPDHMRAIVAKQNLAMVYWERGKLAEAEPLLRDAAERALAKLGPEHPETWNVLGNWVELLNVRRKPAEVEAYLRQLVARVRAAAGPGGLGTARVLNYLATNLAIQKKYAEAEPLLAEVVGIQEQKATASWVTAYARAALGFVILKQGRAAEAEPHLLKGYRGLTEAEIPPQTRPLALSGTAEWLADLYKALAKPDEEARWRAEAGRHKPDDRPRERAPAPREVPGR